MTSLGVGIPVITERRFGADIVTVIHGGTTTTAAAAVWTQ